jgi:PAS domain S-box-containing protein
MSGNSSATTERPPPGLGAGLPEAARTRALDLTVLAAFVVVYATGAQVLDIQSWARQWWVDGAWTIAALATALKCFQVRRALTGPDRLAWSFLGYACLAWFAGVLVRDYYELAAGRAAPFPAVSDLGFLAFAPLFLAALFLYGSQMPTKAMTYRQVCNLGIILSTLIIGLTIVFLEPIRASGEPPFTILAAFAYPLLYWYAFFFGVVRLWLYVWGHKRIVIFLLITGLAAQAVISTLHAYALLGRVYAAGDYADVFWLLGFVLVYWAAVEQDQLPGSAGPSAAAYRMDDRARTLEPLVPALGLLSLLVVLTIFWQDLSVGILPVVLPAGIAFAAFLGVGGWWSHRIETRLRQRVMAVAGALEASEARLAGVIEMIPEAVVATDARLDVVLFNRGAEEIFGYRASEMVGRPLDTLIPVRLRDSHRAHIEAFGRAPETSRKVSERGDIAGLRKDGSEFPAEASVSKFEHDGERIFTVLLHDVTERKAVEEALCAAKEQAELANRAKSEFLANMSHELRTPLNAIIGFSEIIGGEIFGPLGDRRYGEYAIDIHDSGNHLLQIINDILDLAKIEAGQHELQEQPVEVAQVIESCLRLIAGRATKAGVSVEVELPAPITVNADQRKLKQILINLLSNAVKFTGDGGRVAIGARLDAEGTFVLSVRDDGIGIKAELLETVLAPFAQADGSLTRSREGTGLGLPLVKALTELHGGTLAIESEDGLGTTVTVRLPAARVLTGAPPGAVRA